MLLSFPTFNIHSISLFILVIQGYIFAWLMLKRYYQKGQWPDLFLGFFLFITGFDRTSYIIGFMGWYDTFRTTKINYFLWDFSFAYGPILYFYIKSLTEPLFSFRKVHFWHFAPAILAILYEIIMLIHDASQPGFSDVQNGIWLENIHLVYVIPFTAQLTTFSIILYFAFSLQAYQQHRKRIKQFYSNTYHVELNWIRNFLFLYLGLFLFNIITFTIHNQIVELHWEERWYWHLVAAMAMVYIGIKGYYIDLTKLHELTFPNSTLRQKSEKESTQLRAFQQTLKKYMKEHKPYLNPELTLSKLAKDLEWNPSLLSQVINTGFGKNFNDYINTYRVDAVKEELQLGHHRQRSLLGIALDCGFNSKATFNRTFKKLTKQSPTEFLASIEGSNDTQREFETT